MLVGHINDTVTIQIIHHYKKGTVATVFEIFMDSAGGLQKVASACVGPVLSQIFKIAGEIQEITKRTKVNKRQCLRLNERIWMLVNFLQGHTFNDTISESMKLALRNFVIFLQKCVEFMNIFINASFFKRLWNNKNHHEQFVDLHTEITQYTVDLNLGVILTVMFVNKNQHQQDQKLDSSHMQQLSSIKDIECDSTLEKLQQVSLIKSNKFLNYSNKCL